MTGALWHSPMHHPQQGGVVEARLAGLQEVTPGVQAGVGPSQCSLLQLRAALLEGGPWPPSHMLQGALQSTVSRGPFCQSLKSHQTSALQTLSAEAIEVASLNS